MTAPTVLLDPAPLPVPGSPRALTPAPRPRRTPADRPAGHPSLRGRATVSGRGGVPTRSARAARSAARRDPAPAVHYRVTARGRAVLVALLAAATLVMLVLAGAGSQADSRHAPPAARTVTVQPGDTLWQIALRAAPHTDPRVTSARIAGLNAVRGPLVPGRRLVLPG